MGGGGGRWEVGGGAYCENENPLSRRRLKTLIGRINGRAGQSQGGISKFNYREMPAFFLVHFYGDILAVEVATQVKANSPPQ